MSTRCSTRGGTYRRSYLAAFREHLAMHPEYRVAEYHYANAIVLALLVPVVLAVVACFALHVGVLGNV